MHSLKRWAPPLVTLVALAALSALGASYHGRHGWVTLYTASLSGHSVTFDSSTGVDNTLYSQYRLRLRDVSNDSDGGVYFTLNGDSSFDTRQRFHLLDGETNVEIDATTGCSVGISVESNVAEGNWDILIPSIAGASIATTAYYSGTYFDSSGAHTYGRIDGACRDTTNGAFTEILLTNGGTRDFDAGTAVFEGWIE